MLQTMPSRRRRRQRLDVTPYDVDVVPGIVVFWDGEHRTGRLLNVPAYLAMHWQKHSWASIVDEPISAGAASRVANDIPTAQRRDHDRTPCASHDLRDTSTDPHQDQDPPGPPVPPDKGGLPWGSDKNGLYGFPQFCPTESVAAQRDSKHGHPGGTFVTPATPGDRTGSVRARQCPNCSAPVAGRRKWCSEGCRLKAYRRAAGT